VDQALDTTGRLKEPTTQQAIVTANKEIGEVRIFPEISEIFDFFVLLT
jgi:hypothetical protein